MRIEGEIVLTNVDDGKPASNVLIEYSVSGGEPWSSTYADGYKWFRISTDGGKTWSAPMKFIGDNGTSVTIKGTALGHFKEGESIPSGLATGIYLQDPMMAYRFNGKLLTDVSVTAGDGYLLNGYLYVATPTAWQNVGQIKGDKGEPGVNPACYRLVEMGEGKAEATISLDTAKKGISVSVYVLMKFVVYKYQGDSAERLTDVSGFSVEGYLRNAEEAVMVSRGNDGTFVLTYHSTVSGDDMDDYATVKVALRDSNNKIWDLATFPVVLNNGSVYTRTSQMMESIYSNQQGLTKAEQDAKSIKALVYTHGRNLLYDAGFSDKTVSMDGTMGQRRYSSSGVNTVTFGDDGTALISASGNTENKYTGIFWYVPVEALGKYTASVYDVQAGGFDGDKKAYMSIYACDANKKEKTALGGMMIGSDTDGERIVLTSADVPEGTPYLELGIYVIKNGTLKIKCPQLERGEEATDWTLRGTEDGLTKAGVDIERGTVTQYGDRFKWMDATGKNMIAGMDSDGNATFNGIVHAKGGEFTGKVIAESGKFTGEIEAQGGKITGDIDVEGTLNGGTIKGANIKSPILQWDDDSIQLNKGWLEFKGDLLSNYTFRLGDAYVRGWFGAYQRTTLVIKGRNATLYYGNRVSGAKATFQLTYDGYNNTTYCVIPCYIMSLYLSASENVAGVPIDTIMLQDTGSDCYYMLNMKFFQKVTVMSINDKKQSNWIYKNGNLERVAGGLYFNVHQVPPELMTPQPSASIPGAGQMWSASENNDW